MQPLGIRPKVAYIRGQVYQVSNRYLSLIEETSIRITSSNTPLIKVSPLIRVSTLLSIKKCTFIGGRTAVRGLGLRKRQLAVCPKQNCIYPCSIPCKVRLRELRQCCIYPCIAYMRVAYIPGQIARKTQAKISGTRKKLHITVYCIYRKTPNNPSGGIIVQPPRRGDYSRGD